MMAVLVAELNPSHIGHVASIAPSAFILTDVRCRQSEGKAGSPLADTSIGPQPLTTPRLSMTLEIAEIQTIQQLHAYVHAVLCRRENLLEEMFTTHARPLLRGGDVCGLQYLLQGPRCVKLSAVWAADQNVLYCYDANGQRYLKERLSNRLAFETEAA